MHQPLFFPLTFIYISLSVMIDQILPSVLINFHFGVLPLHDKYIIEQTGKNSNEPGYCVCT